MPFSTKTDNKKNDKRNDSKIPKISRRKACYFDANRLEPIFTETVVLKRFVSERGKILPSSKSGVCSKHQRALARSIKRARQVGLLPFTDR